MIHAYLGGGGAGLRQVTPDAAEDIPAEALWLDLVAPTEDETRRVERHLGIAVPTRDEMREIEASSRLYRDGEALFMTAVVLSSSETERPQASPVTFILMPRALVTVRYSEPRPFAAHAQAVQKHATGFTPQSLLVGLLETIVYRAADILEKLAGEMDTVSYAVFEPDERQRMRGPEFRHTLSSIARYGDLDAKIRESLSSIRRLPGYLAQSGALEADKDAHAGLETLNRDVASLMDYCSFLANKISFLLDAVLGLINIEQNGIIKIFSVMAVVLLPPTVVASIYGMNFEHMPELGWLFGYPMALGIMVASSILPYWFFKARGWL